MLFFSDYYSITWYLFNRLQLIVFFCRSRITHLDRFGIQGFHSGLGFRAQCEFWVQDGGSEYTVWICSLLGPRHPISGYHSVPWRAHAHGAMSLAESPQNALTRVRSTIQMHKKHLQRLHERRRPPTNNTPAVSVVRIKPHMECTYILSFYQYEIRLVVIKIIEIFCLIVPCLILLQRVCIHTPGYYSCDGYAHILLAWLCLAWIYMLGCNGYGYIPWLE